MPIRGWFVKNTKHPPGQVKPNNPGHLIKREKLLNNDKTLGHYLEEKYPELIKKKLTFDEWWKSQKVYYGGDKRLYGWFEECWKAAQENK